MLDDEQQLNEAAARYLELLEGNDSVDLAAFAATINTQIREAPATYAVAGNVVRTADELTSFLEDVLLSDVADEPSPMTAEEQALADRVTARVRRRIAGQ